MKPFRRWIALCLCIAHLCPVSARAAQTGRPPVDTLCVVSQTDNAFRGHSFDYHGSSFSFGGCGPASIGNALIGTLGVTDHDTAVSLVRELMMLMADDPPTQRIAPYRLSVLTNPQKLEKYPALSSALTDYEGRVHYARSRFPIHEMQTILTDNDPALFVTQMTLKKDDWNWIRDAVDMLYALGCHDAKLCVGFLGGGTEGTSAPFKNGEYGHYVTLCIPVDEFRQSGVLYLFDSLPRALEEERGLNDEHFDSIYPFASRTKVARKAYNPLLDAWSITRISDSVLRFSPVEHCPANWEETQQHLSLLRTFGTGVVMLACQVP